MSPEQERRLAVLMRPAQSGDDEAYGAAAGDHGRDQPGGPPPSSPTLTQ